MPLTLAQLITAPRDEAERDLIAYFTARCAACRDAAPTTFALLCERHYPFVRSIIDPIYFASVRGQLARLEAKQRLLMVAIDVRERLLQGQAWRAAHPDRAAAADVRIAELEALVDPAFRAMPPDRLLREYHETSALLDHARQLHMRIVDAGTDLETTLEAASRRQRAGNGDDAAGETAPGAAEA